MRQAPLAQNPMLAAYLSVMSKNNGLFYDETNKNHLSVSKLESIELLEGEPQIVAFVFKKGTDTVKHFLTSNSLFIFSLILASKLYGYKVTVLWLLLF